MFEYQYKGTAIIYDGDIIITYEQLNNYLDYLDKHMFSCCHSADSRKLMVIKADESPWSVILYVHCIKRRIPVMLWPSEQNEYADEKLISAYRPYFIWQRSGSNPEGYCKVVKWEGYQLYKSGEEFNYEIHPDLALLLSTSGSTGSNKYVRISYKNLESNTESIINALNIIKNDRAMVMLPLNYTYGLSIVNTYLSVGATLLIPSHKVYERGFWDFADEHKCSAICGVPVLYDLLKTLRFDWGKHSAIKLATQAGGKLTERTERYMLEMSTKYGFDFAVMYGQTEATARMSCHMLNHNPDKLGSAGKAIQGGRLQICGEEIVYQGDNVSMGYAKSYEALSLGDVNKGTLYTGDLGYIDGDGFIYITGREKRIIKIKGVRISLDELEENITGIMGYDCACVEQAGRAVIFISKDKGVGISEKDYKRIYELLNGYGISEYDAIIKEIQTIPHNERGKVEYKKLICV